MEYGLKSEQQKAAVKVYNTLEELEFLCQVNSKRGYKYRKVSSCNRCPDKSESEEAMIKNALKRMTEDFKAHVESQVMSEMTIHSKRGPSYAFEEQSSMPAPSIEEPVFHSIFSSRLNSLSNASTAVASRLNSLSSASTAVTASRGTDSDFRRSISTMATELSESELMPPPPLPLHSRNARRPNNPEHQWPESNGRSEPQGIRGPGSPPPWNADVNMSGVNTMGLDTSNSPRGILERTNSFESQGDLYGASSREESAIAAGVLVQTADADGDVHMSDGENHPPSLEASIHSADLGLSAENDQLNGLIDAVTLSDMAPISSVGLPSVYTDATPPTPALDARSIYTRLRALPGFEPRSFLARVEESVGPEVRLAREAIANAVREQQQLDLQDVVRDMARTREEPQLEQEDAAREVVREEPQRDPRVALRTPLRRTERRMQRLQRRSDRAVAQLGGAEVVREEPHWDRRSAEEVVARRWIPHRNLDLDE